MFRYEYRGFNTPGENRLYGNGNSVNRHRRYQGLVELLFESGSRV
jgi:hypothetical protein